MTVTRRVQTWVFVAAAAGLVAALPSSAEAQRRRVVVRAPVVRSVVYVGPRVYRPYWYDGWYQWGPYYPYPYGYRYPVFDTAASLRIQVTPREAEVYVDGYPAGTVDDFDGVFQRLRVQPGGHEITIFLDGYETVTERLYLTPGSERKLQFAMNRLRAGEQSEPPPVPSARGEDDADDVPGAAAAPRRPEVERQAPPTREVPGRFGTLSIRVQPGDAEIVIDGERWAASSGQDRISIQLTEGRHRIEVRREGFTSFVEDVLIRRGATLTLNVVLSRN